MSITKAYFQSNPLFIPQAMQNNGINSDIAAAGNVKLDAAIKRHERNYLIQLLGSELYAEYMTAPTNEKWSALNALLYNVEFLESPIANYIYVYYLDENNALYDGNLFTTEKKENATTHPVIYHQVKAWNKMVSMNVPIINYLQENIDNIETTAILDRCGWLDLLEPQNSFGL